MVRHSLLGLLPVAVAFAALSSAPATAGGDLSYAPPPAAYAPPPAYYPPPVYAAVPVYVPPPVYAYPYPRFYGGYYGYGPRRYVHTGYYGWRGYGRGPYHRGWHGRRRW
jgi:hypothetical protein